MKNNVYSKNTNERGMTSRILLVEDDRNFGDVLRSYLEMHDFEVNLATDGEAGLIEFNKGSYDLCIFDVMMPKLNGYELTKKIREISQVPILILSAKNQDTDKIIGLNIGADDYISKPFNPLELIARIKAIIRRNYDFNSDETKSILKVKDLVLNTETFSLYKNNVLLNLTPTELKILMILMKEPGKILTKVQIYENINGEYFESDDNTMMVHISRLREKIEDDPKNPKYIKTIRGIGYKIEKL